MSLLGKNNKIPEARLCHVVKWDGFDGYGFNLHAEKGKNGQYIGKVDEGSPSEAAGLKQGDRIVEVNEINISNESHKQVVERIKAFPNETKLLVVDQEADEYFKANNIVIKGTLPNVKVIKTPEKNPSLDDDDNDDDDHHHNDDNTTNDNVATNPQPQPAAPSTDNIEDEQNDSSNNYARSVGSNSSIDEVAQKSISSADSGSTASATANNNSGIEHSRENGNRFENESTDNNGTAGNGNGNVNVSMSGAEQKSLNLKMSAKELRAQLAARKKFDPKKESMDFKLKFDIVQKL